MANVDLLNDYICKKGVKKVWIAEKLGISQQTLISKLNGTVDFKVSEMNKLQEILGIDDKNMKSIFLTN